MGRNYTRPSVVSLTDLQELGAELRIYGEIDDPGMRHFNPSIAWEGNKLKIAIRSCNFAVKKFGEWYLRDGSAYSKTDVLYGDLDPDTLQVSNLTKLALDEHAPAITHLAGLEDARLFMRADGMHAIGFECDRLTRSLHNASTALAEYRIEGNELAYIRTLKKPEREVVEKNWSPADQPSELFDFTYSDTQVYKDGKLIGKPTNTNIHGGTQLLKQKDGVYYLSIVHDKVVDPRFGRMVQGVYDKYIYRHYLAKHNEQGIITEITEPFTFGTHENIEFAAGMVEYNGDFLISFGIKDCKYAIARISREKLMSLFEVKSDARE